MLLILKKNMNNNNKNINTKKVYSINEAKLLTDEYIEKSAKRLQKKLQIEWNKQALSQKKEKLYAKNSI